MLRISTSLIGLRLLRVITRVEAMLAAKFRSADGPFFRSLEKALTALHVERQAYHGGTFVGSHVNKLVKVLKFI